MKKGDFVRRKLSTGTLVGPYMQVMHINGNVVYCDVIGTDEPNSRYLKSNLHVFKHTNVCISEEVLMKLKSGRQSVVSHPMCKRWLNICEKQPKLITFYCLPKNYKYTFVVDNIYAFTRNGKITVKIVLSNMIK